MSTAVSTDPSTAPDTAPDTDSTTAYGAQFAAIYDAVFAPVTPIADAMAWLAGFGATTALELGTGTGRIAIPLARHVPRVVGADCSPEMLAQLRANQGGDAPVVPVLADLRHGVTDPAGAGRHDLVLCVCSTLSQLLTRGEQQQALHALAAHVAPGGRVIVETFLPAAVAAMHAGAPRRMWFVPYGPEQGMLTWSRLDPDGQWSLRHRWFDAAAETPATERALLLGPDELETMAGAAGLRPVSRHDGLTGAAFTGTAPTYTTVFAPC